MKLLLKYILLIIAAVIIGAVSALWMSGLIGGHRPKLATSVEIDHWVADWAIGAKGATPYMRAYVARYGLLALPKTEAVYFVRKLDDEGKLLKSSCNYAVRGQAQNAKWWSITLYDNTGYLVENTQKAYSVDQTGLGDGDWSVEVSAVPTGSSQNWLSSQNAGAFELMLRVYKPDKILLDKPLKNFKPPSVVRQSCKGGAL